MDFSQGLPAKKGPLDGITVLDFSRVLSGPYCTMVLADLGARVIKVERLATGDDTRAFGPFVEDDSAYFTCFNRGKESIALDLKSPRDRELVERMLTEADVLVENFRPGVMDRLGYGAERLAQTHPHLVYASISGFGQTGPMSDLPGYDMVVQAMGGIMSLTGWPDAPPARVGTSFGDLSAGLFAVIGILSSLYKRTRDAQGTRVDIAMLDCQAALMETALATYDVEGKVPTRTGDAHPSLSPFEAYDAQDGRFIIAAGNDQLFMLMADALGNPQLALEPQFLSNAQRCRNRPALIEAIQAITLTAPAAHWIERLNEAGVPCSPINTIDKLFEHPQLAARNMIIQVAGART
ncbi:CaiB/BaiF CoA-transferase family protein, partial [Pseudomonas sp. KK4]|uniref:CaiB/BaiF CoA transferase family protein n=1 Tax=Pseudomonas sp. KK4 TaxID=1855729 RepID=UPI00097C2A87